MLSLADTASVGSAVDEEGHEHASHRSEEEEEEEETVDGRRKVEQEPPKKQSRVQTQRRSVQDWVGIRPSNSSDTETISPPTPGMSSFTVMPVNETCQCKYTCTVLVSLTCTATGHLPL